MHSGRAKTNVFSISFTRLGFLVTSRYSQFVQTLFAIVMNIIRIKFSVKVILPTFKSEKNRGHYVNRR